MTDTCPNVQLFYQGISVADEFLFLAYNRNRMLSCGQSNRYELLLSVYKVYTREKKPRNFILWLKIILLCPITEEPIDLNLK